MKINTKHNCGNSFLCQVPQRRVSFSQVGHFLARLQSLQLPRHSLLLLIPTCTSQQRILSSGQNLCFFFQISIRMNCNLTHECFLELASYTSRTRDIICITGGSYSLRNATALAYKTETGNCFCPSKLAHLAFQRYVPSQGNQLLSVRITFTRMPSVGLSTELRSTILFTKVVPISLHFYVLVRFGDGFLIRIFSTSLYEIRETYSHLQPLLNLLQQTQYPPKHVITSAISRR
jgi:hypothetical protein